MLFKTYDLTYKLGTVTVQVDTATHFPEKVYRLKQISVKTPKETEKGVLRK